MDRRYMDCRRGQNILEYVVLLCVVISALMVTMLYTKRTYQGRLKEESDTLGPQYAPRHSAGLVETITTTHSVSYTGGATDPDDLPGADPSLIPLGEDVPDGMTVTFTDSDTNFDQKESVDSFAREDD